VGICKWLCNKKINDLKQKTSDEYNMITYSNDNINFEDKQEYKKKHITLDDQLRKIFRELLTEIRQEYLFSNEHGLDSYLSTRIRHGTITGQLRKTFSDLYLITTKDSKTDIYLDNRYWIKKLSLEKNLPTFNTIMNNFSKDIDDYNTLIKNSLIQIKIDEPAEALFDFTFTSHFNIYTINHYYSNYMNEVDDYKDFIGYSIDIFQVITENNLKLIRMYFNENVKTYFLNLLQRLEKEINEINQNNQFSVLLNNIRRSRTEIQMTIDTVSSWFETKKREDVNFEIKDAIDTSKEIIDNLFSSSIRLNINYKIQYNEIFQGKYFISFVDCFKIFFENIIEYERKKIISMLM